MATNKGNEFYTFKIRKTNFFFGGLGILIAIILILLTNASTLHNVVSTGGVNLEVNNYVESPDAETEFELFVMSQGPFGTQAEKEAIEVARKFGRALDFKLYFVATKNENGTFKSFYGPNEVIEDMRQLCIIKYSPNEFLDYLSCLNDNYRNSEEVWESCARISRVDVSKINACMEGGKAEKLLSDNIKITNDREVTSSPVYYINGTVYRGGRDENSLTREICRYLPENNEVCKTMPQIRVVKVRVINSDKCSRCDAESILRSLENDLTKINVTEIDYESDEGKALIEKFNRDQLPMFILDESVENHPNYRKVQKFITIKDGDYFLNTVGVKINSIEGLK